MRLTKWAVVAAACLSAVPAACISAVPAGADIRFYYTAGAWSAFAGRTDEGVGVCGMSETGNGRWFGVKYFEHEARLTLHLFKEGWRIPIGTQAKVDMQFDTAPAWHVVATGFSLPNGTSGLEFYIPQSSMQQFGNEMRLSSQVAISFPDGDEGSWTGKLSGSGAAYTAFTTCIQRMTRPLAPLTADRGGTQPFTKPGSSQPFRVPQPPAQAAPVADQYRYENL